VSEPDRQRVVLNVGCGPINAGKLPAYFDGWKTIRVDVDPLVNPDILADLTDLSSIADRSADVVWAAHCIEHLYGHQVASALKEFHRVLRDDGFVCLFVPDLQTVATYVATDRLHETLYQSAAGPISPHDVIFGFGAAIAEGRTSMAHRCGFTPGMLERCFQGLPYGELLLRRRVPQLELMALARITPLQNDAERAALMSAVEP
jgi:SAM-dependent methyltransferase